MPTLIMVGQLMFAILIMVIIHELGHFIAARAFGIKVEKFYLFFDLWRVKLFRFKRGETEYGIGWLPLGGYVKIAGMIDESLDMEAMKRTPQPYEFRTKPAWQRLIVMTAGVIMNAIFGIIILTFVLLYYEKQYLPNDAITDGIYAFELAREIGFRSGDKIIAIDNKKIERTKDIISSRSLFGGIAIVERQGEITYVKFPDNFYRQFMQTASNRTNRNIFIDFVNYPFIIDSVIPMKNAERAGIKPCDRILLLDSNKIDCWGEFVEGITNNAGKDVALTVDRGGQIVDIKVSVDSSGTIGVVSSAPAYKLKNYTFFSALKFGFSDALESIILNVKGLGKIISGEEKASESLQGPVGIAQIYGGVWNWQRFWMITAVLSMVLAFINILPIPALDGGHVFFLTIETITRRKFSDEFMEKVQIIGITILIALMVYIIGNDIWKIFK